MLTLASTHELWGSATTTQYSLVGLCLILLAFVRKFFRDATRSIPSAKEGLPFGLGNIAAYGRDPVQYARNATARYGSIFRVNQILTDTIWLRGAKMNKMYLDTKEVGGMLDSRKMKGKEKSGKLTILVACRTPGRSGTEWWVAP